MPIPLGLRDRIDELNGSGVTPNKLEARLYSLGITAPDTTSAKDILLAYIEYRGWNVTNYRIRGRKLILLTDDSEYNLPRVLFLFVALFRRGIFPRLIAEGQ